VEWNVQQEEKRTETKERERDRESSSMEDILLTMNTQQKGEGPIRKDIISSEIPVRPTTTTTTTTTEVSRARSIITHTTDWREE